MYCDSCGKTTWAADICNECLAARAKKSNPVDLAELDQVTPYLRTGMAFLVYLCGPVPIVRDHVRHCYGEADKFIAQLHEDLGGEE